MSTTTTNPFSRRALLWIFGLGGVSFLCALLFAFVEEDPTEIPDHRANGHSRSAIGHSDAIALLRALDVPVLTSHAASGLKVGRGLLVIAEPDPDQEEAVRQLLEGNSRVLFVLPKRSGTPSASDRAWLGSQELIPEEEVARWLVPFGCGEGSVVRRPPREIYPFTYPSPTLDEPQLVKCDRMKHMLIGGDDGFLLGELDGRYLLADPDVLANHGLGRGDNALVFMQMIEELRDGNGVVFDETVHGGEIVPSLRHELVRPPLIYATLAALLAAAILFWATTGRLGKPLPPPPPLAAGKRLLIENTAALTRQGGHADFAVARYLAQTVQLVAQRTHAPPQLTGEALHRFLEAIGAARGASHRLADLESAVAAAAAAGRARTPALAVAAAQRIAEWRRQMTEERS